MGKPATTPFNGLASRTPQRLDDHFMTLEEMQKLRPGALVDLPWGDYLLVTKVNRKSVIGHRFLPKRPRRGRPINPRELWDEQRYDYSHHHWDLAVRIA
jgi:hypothetical protein